MIISIDPTTYAKTPQAMSYAINMKTFSLSVWGVISPYPTVAIVTKDQYRDVIYYV